MINICYKTPLFTLYNENSISVFAKMEGLNFNGSMKDRAAYNTLTRLLQKGKISLNTTIIESSSGNFALSLASVCKMLGLKFICVIDPNINPSMEKMLSILSANIVKVTEKDINGGYLLKRIDKVKDIIKSSSDIYWINQYENLFNAESYTCIADEIVEELPEVDLIFIPVSSCGTITGISIRLCELNHKAKVIAVDSVGSVIFGQKPSTRLIPGMGSGRVPPILNSAKIFDKVFVNERNTVMECINFLEKTGLMIGGSSGSCLVAIRQYLNQHPEYSHFSSLNVVCVFPDRGERYIDTIYNREWRLVNFGI